MTAKEKAIQLINALQDDVSLEEMIDRLYLLRKIEIGMAQGEAGQVVPHDEVVRRLENRDAS